VTTTSVSSQPKRATGKQIVSRSISEDLAKPIPHPCSSDFAVADHTYGEGTCSSDQVSDFPPSLLFDSDGEIRRTSY